MANEYVRHFTAEDLKPENMPGVVLVDFWATWCGPCRMIAPAVEQLAEEFKDKLTVGKVDVDEQGEAAAALSIMSIPTLIVFRDGKEIERMVGAQGKPALRAMIEKHL